MNIVSNIMPSLDKAIITENLERIGNLNEKWEKAKDDWRDPVINALVENSNIADVCVCSILNNLYYYRGEETFRILKNGANFSYNKEDMKQEFWATFTELYDDIDKTASLFCLFWDLSMEEFIKVALDVFYSVENKEVRAKIYRAVSFNIAKQNKGIILKNVYLEDTTKDKDGNEVTNYIRIDDIHGLANSNLVNDNIESLDLYHTFMEILRKDNTLTEKGKKITEDTLQLRYIGFTWEDIAKEEGVHINTIYRYGKVIEEIGRLAIIHNK